MATRQQQEQLVSLTTMMFNAPPGAEYLAELEALVDAGASMTDIAAELSTTAIFNSQFAGMADDQMKIDLVLSAVGIDVDSPAYAEASLFFNNALANGVSPGAALREAADFLSTTTDEDFATPAAMFRNKVDVGIEHSIERGLSSNNLDELKAMVDGVTADPDSATQAIERVQEQAQGDDTDEDDEGTGGGGGSSGSGGGSNDDSPVTDSSFTLDASELDGDAPATVNGGAGTDTLTVNIPEEGSYLVSALDFSNVTNVERLVIKREAGFELPSGGELTFDLSGTSFDTLVMDAPFELAGKFIINGGSNVTRFELNESVAVDNAEVNQTVDDTNTAGTFDIQTAASSIEIVANANIDANFLVTPESGNAYPVITTSGTGAVTWGHYEGPVIVGAEGSATASGDLSAYDLSNVTTLTLDGTTTLPTDQSRLPTTGIDAADHQVWLGGQIDLSDLSITGTSNINLFGNANVSMTTAQYDTLNIYNAGEPGTQQTISFTDNSAPAEVTGHKFVETYNLADGGAAFTTSTESGNTVKGGTGDDAITISSGEGHSSILLGDVFVDGNDGLELGRSDQYFDGFVVKQASDAQVDGDGELKEAFADAAGDYGSDTINIALSSSFGEVEVYGLTLGKGTQSDTVKFDVADDQASLLEDNVVSIELFEANTGYEDIFVSDERDVYSFKIGFDTNADGDSDSFLTLVDVIGSTSKSMTTKVSDFGSGNYEHLDGIEALAEQIGNLEVTAADNGSLGELFAAASGQVFEKADFDDGIETSLDGFAQLLGFVGSNFELETAG